MLKKLVCLLAAAALLLALPGMALAAESDDYGRFPYTTYIADNTLYSFIKLSGDVPSHLDASDEVVLGSSFDVEPITDTNAGITYVLLVDGSSSLNRFYPLIKAFVKTLAETSPCPPRFVLIPYSERADSSIYDTVDCSASDAYSIVCAGLDSIDYNNSVNLSAAGVIDTIDLLQYYFPVLAGSSVNLIAISDSHNDLTYNDEDLLKAAALIDMSPEFVFHSLIVGQEKIAEEFGGRGLHGYAKEAAQASALAEKITARYANAYRVDIPLGSGVIEDHFVSVSFYLRHRIGEGKNLRLFANDVVVDNVPVFYTSSDGSSLSLVRSDANSELYSDLYSESEELCLPFVDRSAPASPDSRYPAATERSRFSQASAQGMNIISGGDDTAGRPTPSPLPSPEPSAALPSPEPSPSPSPTPAPSPKPSSIPGISGIISGSGNEGGNEGEPKETPSLVIIPVTTPTPTEEGEPVPDAGSEATPAPESSEAPPEESSAPDNGGEGKDIGNGEKPKDGGAASVTNPAPEGNGKDGGNSTDGKKPGRPTEPEATAEAPTEEVTEAPTEEVTEAPTEEVTEAPTEEVTEASTEEVTEAPTEEVTEASTEEVTEASTEEVTEASDEEAAEALAVEEGAALEAVSEDASEEVSEETDEVPAEEPSFLEAAFGRYGIITIAGSAVIIVLLLVVILSRKGKKSAGKTAGGIYMRLEVLSGSCKTKNRELCLADQLIIGRDKNCDIVFSDSEVTTVNSRVFVKDGMVWLEDMDSACGTYLEDMRLYDISRLRSGDEISIGSVRFKFNF